MGKRKYYLTVRYKTKEDFDKQFKEIYYDGYEHGFRDGRINALGYILDDINKDFSAEEQFTAKWEVRNRKLRQWQKEEAERKHKEQEEHNQLIKEVAEEAETEFK